MVVNANKIVPLGCTAGYLDARSRTAEAQKGMKLASHVLHDDYLVRTGKRNEIKAVYPVWVREILVHPEKGGKFKKGADVVDSQTGWIVEGKYLTDPKFINADAFMRSFRLLMDLNPKLRNMDPADLLFMERVGLFIDPEDFDTKNESRIVVIPASIVLLYPFIQENGGMGKADEITRIPLDLAPQNEQEKRWLYKIDGVGVRPLARDRFFDRYGNGRNVSGSCRPHYGFGVTGEAASAPRKSLIETVAGVFSRQE